MNRTRISLTAALLSLCLLLSGCMMPPAEGTVTSVSYTHLTIGLPKNMFFCYNQTGKIAWGGTAIERCRPPDTAKARLLRRPAEGRRRGGEKNAAERERLLEVV